MERVGQGKDLTDAKGRLTVADHLLTMSYPLLKDPKILLSVNENLHAAMLAAIRSFLDSEHKAGRIACVPTEEKGLLETFSTALKHHKLDMTHHDWAYELSTTIQRQNAATTAFSREGKYVLADDNYDLVVLDEERLKDHLHKTKKAIACLLETVTTDAAMPRRR